MTRRSLRLVFVLILAMPGLAVAAGPGTAENGATGDPSIGDFRYQSLPVTSRCISDRGTIAACSGPGDQIVSDAIPATAPSVREVPTPVRGPYCGNGVCDGNETSATCSSDCGGTPSGIGVAIGQGDCGSQPYPGIFASLTDVRQTCAVEGDVGGDVTPFGAVVTLTASSDAAKARVVLRDGAGSGRCSASGQSFVAHVELVCSNGLFVPKSASCGCCPSNKPDCLGQQSSK